MNNAINNPLDRAEPIVAMPTLLCHTCGLVMVTEGRAHHGTVVVRYPCDSCKAGTYLVAVPLIRPIEYMPDGELGISCRLIVEGQFDGE